MNGWVKSIMMDRQTVWSCNKRRKGFWYKEIMFKIVKSLRKTLDGMNKWNGRMHTNRLLSSSKCRPGTQLAHLF